MQSLLLITFCVLAVFIPSAKIMAYIVEKKKHTITVGGAVFVMIIAAPWIINGVSMLNLSGGFRAGDSWVFLSSMITAYAFGEGFGRLACISFGCCYGRPVSGLPAFLRKIFSRVNFVYHGKTKKIAYHDNLDGVEVVPVQAITAVLYTMTGLAGLYFFFEGNFIVSFFLSLTVTQIWRFASEFLRADYRGNGLLSAYQKMSLLAVPYYVLWYFFTGTSDKGMPVIADGLWFLWNPGVILVMILMWAGCLFYTGISSVTSSMITIYVNEEKI
jgi:hypothetical protein